MAKSLLLLSTLLGVSWAQDGAGMLGFGLHRYNPSCAATCATIASLTKLSCTEKGMKYSNHMSMINNPPSCLQSNEPYLTTAAYCIKQRCEGQTPENLEAFWRREVGRLVGSFEHAHPPKWTYQEALSHVDGTPRATLILKKPLNETAVITDSDYALYKGTYDMDVYHEDRASLYS